MITAYRETPALLANVQNLIANRNEFQAQLDEVNRQIYDITSKRVKLDWRRGSNDVAFTVYNGIGLQVVEQDECFDAYYLFNGEPVLLTRYPDLASAEAALINYLKGDTNEGN